MLKTLNQFSSFIILSNAFCINRSYLVDKPKEKIICNSIFVTATTSIIGAIIYDMVSSNNENPYGRVFHLLLLFELALLSFEAMYRKTSFEAIKRLDEKCTTDVKEYHTEIKEKVSKITYLTIASITIDIIGLSLLETRPTIILILTVSFTAHDSELSFYALLIEIINTRLSNLKDVSLNNGSKVYSHVLIASSHFNEEFTLRVLVMFGITFITTVLYSLKVILADSNLRLLSLAIYLMWRELKSLHSVWLFCYAAAKTESICNNLAFYLATRLTLDPSIKKEKNPEQNKILKRWYNIILNFRPRFISLSVLSIGLSVPLNLIGISINYILIIVQMYLAYK